MPSDFLLAEPDVSRNSRQASMLDVSVRTAWKASGRHSPARARRCRLGRHIQNGGWQLGRNKSEQYRSPAEIRIAMSGREDMRRDQLRWVVL